MLKIQKQFSLDHFQPRITKRAIIGHVWKKKNFKSFLWNKLRRKPTIKRRKKKNSHPTTRKREKAENLNEQLFLTLMFYTMDHSWSSPHWKSPGERGGGGGEGDWSIVTRRK